MIGDYVGKFTGDLELPPSFKAGFTLFVSQDSYIGVKNVDTILIYDAFSGHLFKTLTEFPTAVDC